MSDYLIGEFRALLNTSMDSVLKRAVFEIMMIFENSVRGHQKELAQKEEEVAHLKIKLQIAELNLSEIERGCDRGAEMKKSEDVPNAPEHPSDVPEIHFEVPDDWCAPLGCETMVKQDNGICPSIRLRKLSIPLSPLPAMQEVVNCNIDSHQRRKGLRRSRRVSSLNKQHKHKDEESRRPPVRNDMKKLLQDVKQENADQTGRIGLRRRRHSSDKERENTTLSKREERKLAAAESTEKEMVKKDSKTRNFCKFCQKEFDTVFGLNVHIRSHKKCKGCKKEFPFPSALRTHKAYCKLQKLLARKTRSTDPPKPESCDDGNQTTPSKKEVVVKEESTPSSIQENGSAKKHPCGQCTKKFYSRWRLKEHMHVHTGEKPYLCNMCPKKFRVNQSLKLHIEKVHKDQTDSTETNENLDWTKPIEETEDCGDLTSPRRRKVKQSPRTTAQNDVQIDGDPDTRPDSTWQTMGTRCPDGFSCMLCKKLLKRRYQLIEHYRTHTGEKPIKCDVCSSGFRSRGQLSMHKKTCKSNLVVAQCENCNKKFLTQTRYIMHRTKCHRDQPFARLCKVCGKGFHTKGHLRNHMKHLHK